jgi:hypothetical protein
MRFLKILSVSTLSFAAFTVLASHAPGQNSGQDQTPITGKYVSTDPLAGVRYDNRYDISLGAAYARFMPGPNAVIGDNLGGLDFFGSYWFSRRFAAEGNVRYYVGTAGAPPAAHQAPYFIAGPFVSEVIFTGGIEWLGPHNKHGALIAHALGGGAYGDFEHDLRNTPRDLVGFYSNGFGPAAVFGGHIDLNRSPRWVFRITPDALLTRYHTDYQSAITVPKGSYNNWNFALSVGMEYKFKGKR